MKSHEKSRRVRNYEPQSRVAEPDDWYLGFASALAQIWRLHHDGQMVRHILSASGIMLKHFESAGVDEFDLSAVREAIRGRREEGERNKAVNAAKDFVRGGVKKTPYVRPMCRYCQSTNGHHPRWCQRPGQRSGT